LSELQRTPGRAAPAATAAARLLLPALVVLAWAVVLVQPRAGPPLFSAEAWARVGGFVSRLAGMGIPGEAAFARGSSWASIAGQALTTLSLSVLAAGLAGSAALLTVHLAARPGAEGPPARLPRRALGACVRGAYVLARSIPELVWALLMVLVLRPSPLAAALALGIHNAGVLGRLLTDVVEDLDPRPARALAATGAGAAQAFLYGALPRMLPQVLTFVLYRWEVIIRTTVIVEAVTGTGMGSALRFALSGREFTTVTVVLTAYVALVLAVDLLSAILRRTIRG